MDSDGKGVDGISRTYHDLPFPFHKAHPWAESPVILHPHRPAKERADLSPFSHWNKQQKQYWISARMHERNCQRQKSLETFIQSLRITLTLQYTLTYFKPTVVESGHLHTPLIGVAAANKRVPYTTPHLRRGVRTVSR
jgi:hypothetical protein